MGTLDMEFDITTLSKEEIALMERLEEDIIEKIKTENISDSIRFWEPKERIPDSEIEQRYPTIYSVALSTEYRKKYRKSTFNQPIICKNWLHMDNFLANSAYIQLALEEQNKLVIWSKTAYRLISKIFKDRFGFHLKAVRFDFLPQEDGKYVIPYLPLCNLRLASNEKDKKTIPIKDYLSEITCIVKLIEQMQSGASAKISDSNETPSDN